MPEKVVTTRRLELFNVVCRGMPIPLARHVAQICAKTDWMAQQGERPVRVPSTGVHLGIPRTEMNNYP